MKPPKLSLKFLCAVLLVLDIWLLFFVVTRIQTLKAVTMSVANSMLRVKAPHSVVENQPIASPSASSGQFAVDTANWQTYRNEKYGFRVKYPSDWSINQDEARYFESNESYPRFVIEESNLNKNSQCYATLIFKNLENPEKFTYSLYPQIDQKQKCQRTLDQILSMFKFLK